MDVIPFDRVLFERLVCPLCRSPLRLAAGALVCTGAPCRRKYAIADGIPVMLVEEAVELERADWEAAMAGSGPVTGSARTAS